MTVHRPPVIPEIAKAYQADPRTALALAAMKAGTSTAPVATGQYGIADGIARALQAVAGGFIDSKQQDKYVHGDPNAVLADGTPDYAKRGEDGLLVLRSREGRDGLTGLQAPASVAATPAAAPAAVLPPATPDAGAGAFPASQVAARLGAPPPAPLPPPGPPPIPSAPIPASTGGLPARSRPLSVAPAGATSSLAPPVPEAIPDAPPPVARPDVPKPVGATRSKLLDAAYRIMVDADPYESDRGQELYASGLSDQDKLNEAAAERAQRAGELGYETDARVYTSAQEADRAAKYADRTAAQTRNFTAGESATERTFKAGESSLERAKDIKLESMRAASAANVEGMREASDGAMLTLDPEAVRASAEQLLNGDPSPLQSMGYGKYGVSNRIAVKNEMYRQAKEKGISPKDIADINARYFGEKSEARAAGTRVGATDVATSEVIPLAAEAKTRHADLIAQGPLVPWNKAIQMVQTGTSSPELARAVAANSAVANAYGRSFGTGIVSDTARKTALAQLQVAWGTPAYEAALDQIVRNTHIERGGARAALGGISGGISGGTGGGASQAPPSGGAVPPRKPGESITAYLARTGG